MHSIRHDYCELVLLQCFVICGCEGMASYHGCIAVRVGLFHMKDHWGSIKTLYLEFRAPGPRVRFHFFARLCLVRPVPLIPLFFVHRGQ